MYIKRNVYFSAVDQETGEERLFSTTEIMTEEAYQKEFGEKAKGAAYASGAIAGTGAAAYGTIKGSQKLADHLAKSRVLKAKAEKNEIMKEAAAKAKQEAKKWAGKRGVQADRVADAINTGLAKASGVKVTNAGKVEQVARKIGNVLKNIK